MTRKEQQHKQYFYNQPVANDIMMTMMTSQQQR